MNEMKPFISIDEEFDFDQYDNYCEMKKVFPTLWLGKLAINGWWWDGIIHQICICDYINNKNNGFDLLTVPLFEYPGYYNCYYRKNKLKR